jgi:phage gpG-like protein
MSRYFEGLREFSEFLERGAALHEELIDAAVGLSAEILYKKAYADFGDSTKLADLAPATQDEREALGYARNEPLLRDGTLLRDSLESGHDGNLAGIGSAEPILAYHEYGYVNARTGSPVPPRPVLKIAMQESEEEIAAVLEDTIGATLGLAPTLRLQE